MPSRTLAWLLAAAVAAGCLTATAPVPAEARAALKNKETWEPEGREGLTMYRPPAPPRDPTPRPAELGEQEIRTGAPPPRIQEVADGYMRERLGESNFKRYVRLIPEASKHYNATAYCWTYGTDACDRWGWRDYYEIAYNFTIPALGAEAWRVVKLVFTPEATFVGESASGVPHCAVAPQECDFPVTREDAIRTARDAGLAEGVKPWEATFVWHQAYDWPEVWGTYAWSVKNTESTDEPGGAIVVVDANDGRVQRVDRWFSLDFP